MLLGYQITCKKATMVEYMAFDKGAISLGRKMVGEGDEALGLRTTY